MGKISDELEKLVFRVSGGKKSRSAIMMPSGKNARMLSEHLEILSRQTKKGFDILVIGEMPESVPKSLNIIHYAERLPLGSSGSFAIGQVLAYSLGYEFVINADLDCFPKSDDFVQKLVEMARKEGKAILPVSDEEGKKSVYCINRYGIVPRTVMEKAGFEYAMFFKGAEDIDYQLRLSSRGLLAATEELRTSHPYLSMVLFEVASRGPKYLYYYRAGFAILNLTLYDSITGLRVKDSIVCAARLLYNYFYAFAYSSMASRVLFGATLDAFTMNLRARYEKTGFSIPEVAIGADAAFVSLEVGHGNEPSAVYFGQWDGKAGMLGKIMRRVSHAGKLLQLAFAKGKCFKPSSEFIETYGFLVPYLMFLKPVAYKGKAYGWGKHPAYLLAGFALTALALPIFPFLAAFALVKVWAGGDYPPKPGNVSRMLKNFSRAIGAG